VTSSPPHTVRENVFLAPLTSFGIGGPARYFATADTRESVVRLVAWAGERDLPLLILGGGSNLLVSDDGFPGLVLRVGLAGVSWRTASGESVDGVEVHVAAGENWDMFVEAAVARGLAGIECLSGIPGAVGATPIQNVGAYGQEVAQTIRRVEALDLDSGSEVAFSADECDFGYRASRFKHTDSGRYLILAVTYGLRARSTRSTMYADLARYFAENGVTDPSVADVRTAVLAIRRSKSMVLDSDDPDSRSAGSFFLNPIVSADALAELEGRADDLGLGPVPRFAAADGLAKVPAAWLIERAGFRKGYVRGRAAISRRHALALVNRGDAAAYEVVALAREIRDGVEQRFGIRLDAEPRLVGVSLE
jgi:UDP-N-acetylmuramate dehydrogenase